MLTALDGPYALAFVDGFHEQGAPLADVRALLPKLEETAAVLFHDLLVPDVQAALNFLKLEGFRTRIWNTMQVMAIAWRGDYEPPAHGADERMPSVSPELAAAHAD